MKIPGMVFIYISFVPWIMHWVMETGTALDVLLPFLAATIVLIAESVKKIKDMVSIAAACYFGISLVFILIGYKWPVECKWISYMWLSAVAIGSVVVRAPFTYMVSRIDWPPEYWNMPLFFRINAIISTYWGVAYLLMGIAAAQGMTWFMLPPVILGIILSIVLPVMIPTMALKRKYGMDPYGLWWKTPVEEFRSDRYDYDVIVIGAGIGGLTAAALLAKRGLRVLVIERHYMPGGYCTTFARRGFLFDVGVFDISGVHDNGPVTRLLRELGIDISMRRNSRVYIFPEHGIKLEVPQDYNEFARKLCEMFPEERDGIQRFFEEAAAVFDEIYGDVDRLGGVPLDARILYRRMGAKYLVDYPRTHPHFFRWSGKSFMEMLNSMIKSNTLKKILSVLCGYAGGSPEELEATSMCILFAGYFKHGGYYPEKGSGELARILAKTMERYGGKLLLRTRVEKVVIRDSRVVGVIADGKFYSAPVVVCNAHAHVLLKELLPPGVVPESYKKHVLSIPPSVSAAIAYIGLDADPGLPENMSVIENNHGYSIHIRKHDDCYSLVFITLSTPEEWPRNPVEYKKAKKRFARWVLSRLERLSPGISSHVKVLEIGTPLTCEKYTLNPRGAIYGLFPGIGKEYPLHRTPVKGLYLVGASSFPGGGIEAVVISGTIVANDIKTACESN